MFKNKTIKTTHLEKKQKKFQEFCKKEIISKGVTYEHLKYYYYISSKIIGWLVMSTITLLITTIIFIIV